MSSDTQIFVALTPLLRSLATGKTAGVKDIYSLPGRDGPEKKEFAVELAALVKRIRDLEVKADQVEKTTLEGMPDTNGSPFPLSSGRSSPVSISPALQPQRNGTDVQVDHQQILLLHEHVKSQQEIIQRNRQEVATLQEEVRKSNEQMMAAARTAQVATLQRELKKSQQANEAFSKSLREIGEIVTAGKYRRLLFFR